MFNKPMSMKDYVNCCIENNNKTIADNKRIMNQGAFNESAALEATESLVTTKQSHVNTFTKYTTFIEDVKTSLLAECLYKVYNESQGIHIVNDGDESIMRSLVTNFIKENSVNDLLFTFRNKTGLLSEMSNLVNKYYKKVLEGVDKTDPNTFNISSEIKDNFFDDLNIIDSGEATESIKIRVQNAVDEFIQDNVNDKIDIEDTLKETKAKVAAATSESVKESFEQQGKRKISTIRNKTRQNVFGKMVSGMCESVLNNDFMHREYMPEGKLNLDKIVERTKLMYSFLETLNTIKAVKVDDEYINAIVENMK